MSEPDGVRSEKRGFHWVAWRVRPGESSPRDSVIVVGKTREEAEERARARTDAPTPR
jgi:hypothetical protein